MNAKAKAELVRQLTNGCKHFSKCGVCNERFASSWPQDSCPNGCYNASWEDDEAYAADYYSAIIDAALKWGEDPGQV